MCGHGTIGVAVTLARLGRIGAARIAWKRPSASSASSITATARVTIENVPSYRLRKT